MFLNIKLISGHSTDHEILKANQFIEEKRLQYFVFQKWAQSNLIQPWMEGWMASACITNSSFFWCFFFNKIR